jgi:hypothetical protein
MEKKILEEVYKIFQENNGSFYLSYTLDLTNSIERQHSNTYDEIKRGRPARVSKALQIDNEKY